MVAAIDVGNSNIAIGLFEGESLTHHWRITTRPTMTSDECEITVSALLAKDGVAPSVVDRTVVSSVVPSLTQELTNAIGTLFGEAPLLVDVGLSVGLSITIDNPRELGTDLFANAVAGWGRTGGACIIVDFGTALSLTAVRNDGAVAGVAIAPGLSTAVSSLSGNAAQLPAVPLALLEKTIGTNTVHSIQSGIMFGYRGLVDSLVRGAASELGGTVKVIATGGQAAVMGPHCKSIDEIDPWLTLDGLRRISEAVSDRQGQ